LRCALAGGAAWSVLQRIRATTPLFHLAGRTGSREKQPKRTRLEPSRFRRVCGRDTIPGKPRLFRGSLRF
jgi:hypothetical protein